MATTATPYGIFFTDLGSGVHVLATDTTKVALLTAAYTPNYDTHASYADVSANEITGTGYTAGGNTLTNKSWTYDGTTDRSTLTADPSTWTALTGTFRYGAVYKSTGSPATSKLIGLLDFTADRSYAGEDFQLTFPNGVLRIRAATT